MAKKIKVEGPPRPRRVMIGTPSYDGRFDAFYVHGLLESIRQAPGLGIELMEWWQMYDSNLGRARDRIVQKAVEADIDDLVFIDADIGFEAPQLWKILSHDVPFVGGTYLRKDQNGVFEFKPDPKKTQIDSNSGLLEVDGLGCGFLRMTRSCFTMLYNSGPVCKDGDHLGRSIFEFSIEKGERVSEDINLCRKWKKMRGKVFLDVAVTLRHTGIMSLQGDLARDFPRLGLTIAPTPTPTQKSVPKAV